MTAATGILNFGTRASALARWQTRFVAHALRATHAGLDFREVLIETAGDRDQSTALPEIGGTGLFTEALEAALLTGRIDVAVHSLKDLPIASRSGLRLAAICFRVDARDVLVSRDGWTLETLPPGARVGTSSNRRIAQLRAERPDLRVEPLRGNVDTRVRKARDGHCDAACLAAAGIERLGLTDAVSEFLPLTRMLPAPGQGALAVQCREDDAATNALLSAIDDPAVRASVDAERGFLAGLGGGCSAPIAAYAIAANGSSDLRLDGLVAAVDGSRVVRVSDTGRVDAARDLGRRLADDALAQGAGAFLS